MTAKVRRRSSFRLRVNILVVAMQIPALVAAGTLGHPTLFTVVAALAVVLSAAWFSAQEGVYLLTPRGRLHLYLGLWPFFAWWLACVVFAVLCPIALLLTLVPFVTSQVTLGVAATVALVAGIAGIRRTPRVVHLEVAFPDLPVAFDGYRVGQISDVHCGSFAPEARVRRWAQLLAGERPDLVTITGDLVAHGTEEVEAVARALSHARAPDGALACMGNHDYFGAGSALVEALTGEGIRVLRNESITLERGGERLVVAGVDDTWSGRADLPTALAGLPPGSFVILLAHDPNLFPEAARRGVHLTLSGHTHGGQVALPFAARTFNFARLVSPFTAGLYRLGGALLYVNRGAGTSGPPIRLGVPAEVTVLTLRRA